MPPRNRNRLLALCLVFTASFAVESIRSSADDRQREVANRARSVLNLRCFACHGQGGVAKKNLFVLDRERLLASKAVTPGDASSLLLRLVDSDEMPLGGPPLSDEEKSILKAWVQAGAPSWEPEPGRLAPRFISERDLLSRLRDDLLRTSERDRPYVRYFSIAHLSNSGATVEEMAVHSAALAKLINSLSWHREITLPLAIDEAKTLLRIDLRDYNWTAATWNSVLAVYPYGLRTPDSEVLSRITGLNIPYVRADWFISTASVPPLYHQLMGLPGNIRELEKMLGVDAARDIQEEKNIARAGIRASGVSQNNRVLERHVSPYGAYWKSFDFSDSLGAQNIFLDPLRLNPAGGEIIFNLPNGLQGYFLIDQLGRRLDEAPISIVSDHNNPEDPVIRNGRSCMSCHYAGVKRFTDDVRPVVSRMSAGLFERDKALALYPDQQILDQLIEKDRRRFATAVDQLRATAESAQSEPINIADRKFSADLTAAQAAAEAGLAHEEFQRRLRASARLIALGFGQLLVGKGGVKRDAWQRGFPNVVRELGLGEPTSGPFIFVHSANGSRLTNADANPAVVRFQAAVADPAELLRTAKTIFIRSETVFLKPSQLEEEFRKTPEFAAMGLLLVRDRKAADLVIDLDRPLFTYTFTFTVMNPQTSVVATSGKVKAFDGNYAAPKIAKELMKRFQAARQGLETTSLRK